MHELLTNEEMSEADRLAIAAGVDGRDLMKNAGRAVAQEVALRFPDAGSIAVLCGPGNNGGDGFVAARHLVERGYSVSLGLLGERDRLSGDAAAAARDWTGEVSELDPSLLDGAEVVIDALFGAGIARRLEGIAAACVAALNVAPLAVVAVDVPSGIDGTSGQVMGAGEGGIAVDADVTVTFFRRKPGHVLLPGRLHCGEVVLADIDIDGSVLEEIGPSIFSNGPALWAGSYPWPSLAGHKYDRGHAVVVSGPAGATGAGRLAARGAMRAGAGLVTLASPTDAFATNAAQLSAAMIAEFDGPDGLVDIMRDERKNACLIGPGAGVGARTRDCVEALLSSRAAIALDADALTTFADEPDALFAAIGGRTADVVLTPHEGEFVRLFGHIEGSKFARAREGARRAGATVLLKGPDSVISDGQRCAINENAPPWLATAGAGDVLAGFAIAHLAQGMNAFDAAAAATWMHAAAAQNFGPGLIAEDLPEALPAVLSELWYGAE